MSATYSSAHSAAHTIEQAVRTATACHRAGQLQQAATLYDAVLQVEPNHPDANHNLGVLRTATQGAEAGLTYLLAAVAAEPTVAQYWLSYIDALDLSGRRDEAKSVLAQASQFGLQGEHVEKLSARLNENG